MEYGKDNKPLLTQFSKDGFIDCAFQVENFSEEDNYYKFLATASYEGDMVGVKMKVLKNLQHGFDEEWNLIQENVAYGGVIFESSGVESDKLVQAISQLYNVGCKIDRMVDEFSFTAIVLSQDKFRIESDPIRIKIFGNDFGTDEELEQNYFESFFHLDIAHEFVAWNEKDEGYRNSLLKGIGKTDT